MIEQYEIAARTRHSGVVTVLGVAGQRPNVATERYRRFRVDCLLARR
jgi:hypothetical protein